MKTNTTLIVFLVIGIVLVVALFLYVLFRENAMAKKVKELDEVKKLTSIIDATTAYRLIQGSKFKGTIQIKNSFNITTTDEERRYIVSFLSKMTALQHLDLSDNDINDKDVEILAPALGNMTALRTLSLGDNEIGNKGVEILAPALGKMTALKDLDLSDNAIGIEGATALALALKDLNLKELDLSNNEIGNEGATALAPALGNMTRLRSVNLTDNNIGKEGATALVLALGKITALQFLDLSNNNIEQDDQYEIEKKGKWKNAATLLLHNSVNHLAKIKLLKYIAKAINKKP